MLRHTAGAIAAGIGFMFVLWILSQFLPGPPSGWFGQADIDKWIPFNAGSAIWEHQANGLNPFSPWIGFAVFCAYAAVARHRRAGRLPAPRRLAARGHRRAPVGRVASPRHGSAAVPGPAVSAVGVIR